MASFQHPVDARSADLDRLGDLGGAEAMASATRTGRWRTSIEYNASPLRDRVYACGSYSTDLGEILGLALDLRFSVLRDLRR